MARRRKPLARRLSGWNVVRHGQPHDAIMRIVSLTPRNPALQTHRHRSS
jgi:hypothetical protein